MRWTVKNYDCNRDKIIDYDLFPHFQKFLLKLKKEKKNGQKNEVLKFLELFFSSTIESIVELKSNLFHLCFNNCFT